MGRIIQIDAAVTVGTAIAVVFRCTGGTSCLCGMLLDEPIVFALQATQELEKEHKSDDTNAGAREHASGGNVPCRRQEACVESIPVPEHL